MNILWGHFLYNLVDFHGWQFGVEADRLLPYIASIFFCSLMLLVETPLRFPAQGI